MTKPDRPRMMCLILLLGGIVLVSRPAAALHYLEPEEAISELLVRPHEQARAAQDAEEKVNGRSWAIVPQVGYGPETSFVFGAKFTNRDTFSSGVTLDLDGVYAVEGQQAYTVAVASPKSFGPDFPIVVRATYRTDPRRRFFGLGNNEQGPDQASSHEFQRFGGDMTVGWRLLDDLSLNIQGGAWNGDVQLGDQIDDEPQTVDRFPARTSPSGLSPTSAASTPCAGTSPTASSAPRQCSAPSKRG